MLHLGEGIWWIGRGWRSRRIVGRVIVKVRAVVRVWLCCYVGWEVVGRLRGLERAMLRESCDRLGRWLLDRLGRS